MFLFPLETPVCDRERERERERDYRKEGEVVQVQIQRKERAYSENSSAPLSFACDVRRSEVFPRTIEIVVGEKDGRLQRLFDGGVP